MEIEVIKNYYDLHTKAKLESYINGNQRVDRAFLELSSWFVAGQKEILEIGCGIGSVAWRLATTLPHTQIHAFDISPRSIEIAKKLFWSTNLLYHCEDGIELLDFKKEQKFDVIYLIDVFEHLPDGPKSSVESIIRKRLSKDGIVFMSCPTPAHQDWLRKNKPDGLQPVDLDINLSDLMDFANKIQRRILFYKEISVWNEGDYFHIIFGNKAIKNKSYSNGNHFNIGIKNALQNKFYSILKKNQKEKELRKTRVRTLFPEFFNS